MAETGTSSRDLKTHLSGRIKLLLQSALLAVIYKVEVVKMMNSSVNKDIKIEKRETTVTISNSSYRI